MGHCRKRGQATLEYVLVFMALLGVAAALMFLVRSADKSSRRTTELVCSEDP